MSEALDFDCPPKATWLSASCKLHELHSLTIIDQIHRSRLLEHASLVSQSHALADFSSASTCLQVTSHKLTSCESPLSWMILLNPRHSTWLDLIGSPGHRVHNRSPILLSSALDQPKTGALALVLVWILIICLVLLLDPTQRGGLI